MMVDWCTLLIDSEKASCVSGMLLEPVRFAYRPYFFSERIIFFSHNKLVNNTFQLGFSAKRTGLLWLELGNAHTHVLGF
jgi:hypothetical protein